MVLLNTTPKILAYLASLSPASLATVSDADTIPIPINTQDPISHRKLVVLSRLQIKDGKLRSLDELLRGTAIYIPPPPAKPEPSPEYVALMARLRREQEQREYAALISKQRSLNGAGEYEDDEDSLSPSLVLNMLLSVIIFAAAVFHLTKWWSNDGIRVLFSLGSSISVGIAEVVLYSIYLTKVKMAKVKERGKKEKKTLIGEYKPSEEDDVHMRSMTSKEEIWGKGINGGMRRRVREKWEKEQKKSSVS